MRKIEPKAGSWKVEQMEVGFGAKSLKRTNAELCIQIWGIGKYEDKP